MTDTPHPEMTSFAISEATLFGLPGEIIVRGWAAQPDQVASVRIRVKDKVIGSCPLNAARPDVAAKLGHPEHPAHGFIFVGRADPAISRADHAEVIFMGRNGKPLHMLTRPIAQRDRLDALEIVYDFDSRQLRLKGCLFPSRQLRTLNVVFARGTSHTIRNLFQFRPEAKALDPEQRTLYSGFQDRIPFVGEGDVRTAQLKLNFTDGTHKFWPFPADLVQFNSPEGEVEEVVLDWVHDRIKLRGWYRSHTPVTGLSLTLNDQKVYGIPAIAPSERAQKAHGFRGTMAQEFTLAGALSTAVSNPDALLRDEIEGQLRLQSQETELLATRTAQVTTQRIWGEIILAQFDRRNNMLHIDGILALPITPTHAQLVINNRRLDEPLPLQAQMIGGTGNFSWTHEINGVIPANGQIGLDFFDADGGEIGHLSLPAADCLTVSRHGAVDGLNEADLAKRLMKTYAKLPQPTGPSVCFVLQGNMTGVGSGGGARRLADLMESFHEAGYMTMLIDRSEPWNLLRWPQEYRRLRRFCHRHLMVPQPTKRHMGTLLADMIDAGDFPQPAGFEPGNRTMSEILRAPPAKQASEGLATRIDPQFNVVAAALLNGLGPRVAITSYAWSAPIHALLHPSIHGMIDTNDLQALRAEAFAAAQAAFGPEAVPDLEKFAVSLDEEVALLGTAQSLITISRSEQAFLCEHIDPSKVVYAGLSGRSETPLPPSAADSRRVLFVGNLYEPNIDAANQMLQHVWPAVVARVPDAVLTICGRVCSALTDPELPSVQILGPVEDLEAEYEAAALTLNPVRFGTGASVKLVETLALGRCILSTPVGARNFEDAAEEGALQLAELEDFAGAICELLLDPERRHQMEAAAIAHAQEKLAPHVVHSDLFNLLESRLYY